MIGGQIRDHVEHAGRDVFRQAHGIGLLALAAGQVGGHAGERAGRQAHDPNAVLASLDGEHAHQAIDAGLGR
ncbi:MAG TPA: hypothetical protein PKA17_04335, partial [Phenylobacterium sp.]|nr:hypothetical protein [Phenylobacterium sp.]